MKKEDKSGRRIKNVNGRRKMVSNDSEQVATEVGRGSFLFNFVCLLFLHEKILTISCQITMTLLIFFD